MISYDDLNHRHRHRPRQAGYSSAPAPSPLSRRAPAPAPGLPRDPDRSRSARDLTATRRGRNRVLANPMRTYLQFYKKWVEKAILKMVGLILSLPCVGSWHVLYIYIIILSHKFSHISLSGWLNHVNSPFF